MRRVAPTLPVSTNMLRHFAVLTLVITAGLAMFASGEGEQVLSGQVKQRQLQTQAIRAEREKATQHTVVIDGLRVAPGTRLGGSEVDTPNFYTTGITGNVDQPASAYAATAPDGPGGPGTGDAAQGPGGGVMPPPAGQMRLRRKRGEPAVQPSARPRPTQQDIDAVVAASARRAGTTSE